MELSQFLFHLISLIAATGLGAAALALYRHQRIGVLYAALELAQVVILSFNIVRVIFNTPEVAPMARTGVNLGLAAYGIVLLLIVTSLYAPEWWERRRILYAVLVPYVAFSLLIAIDALIGLALIAGPVELRATGLWDARPGPLMSFVLRAQQVGWLVIMAVLIRGLIAFPRERFIAGTILSVMVISIIGSIAAATDPWLAALMNIVYQVLYVVLFVALQRRIFDPSRVLLRRNLALTSEGIAVINDEHAILYANSAASQQLGLREGGALTDVPEVTAAVMAASGQGKAAVTHAGRELEVLVTALEERGRTQLLIQSRDVTERRQREATLQAQNDQLQALVELVRELELPVIPLLEGVLLVPLLGHLDRERLDRLSDQILSAIHEQRAQVLIVDITGIPELGIDATALLEQLATSARLMGTRVVLTGVSTTVALALTRNGSSLRQIQTTGKLSQGLELVLSQLQQHGQKTTPSRA